MYNKVLFWSVELGVGSDHVGRIDADVEGDVVRVANDDHVEHQAAPTNIPAHTEIQQSVYRMKQCCEARATLDRIILERKRC
jgi:hypothetical protein